MSVMILSDASKRKLATCHPDLVRLVELASDDVSIMVICGYRGEKDQNAAYAAKKSKLKWPNSRHNSVPSEAVDLGPMSLNWNDKKAFVAMAKIVKAAAEKLGIEIEWGGDWAFQDLDHFQLRLKSEAPRIPGSESGRGLA